MKHANILYLCMLCLLVSCKQPSHRPDQPTLYASEFTSGQMKLYGAFYADAALDNNVVSLDLFSNGLRLDILSGYMKGTGTNLFFSDIFLPPTDSLLLPGDYVASSTGEPFTFLPGTDFEGNFTGSYLLDIAEDQLAHYALVPEGTLHVERDGDVWTFSFAGKRSNGIAYTASFSGKLRIRDAR